MMRRNSSLFFMVYLFGIFVQQAYATSLDGTASIVYQDFHNVFHNGDSAVGFARINNGFTIAEDEVTPVVTLGTFVAISGPLDMRKGKVVALSDVYFSSSVTFSSGGQISGQGNTIHLGGDLEIPDDVVFRICTNTIIDGGGCMLTMDCHSQFVVDTNVTLTLKNVIFKTTKNGSDDPAIQLRDNTGVLALDNVVLSLGNDFTFTTGHLFIHNDVAVTGTSTFCYESDVESFITKCSTWLFDKDTTFAYKSSDVALLLMENKTSILAFDNANLVAPTGIRLTKGRLCLDNCVTLSSDLDNGIKLGYAAQGDDLDVTLMSGARVCVSGLFNYDPA